MSGSGGLTKAGAGLLTLNAVNSFTGPTTVNGGTLAIADPAGNALAQSSGVTVNAGGTLGLNVSAGSVGSLAGAGNVNLNNGRLDGRRQRRQHDLQRRDQRRRRIHQGRQRHADAERRQHLRRVNLDLRRSPEAESRRAPPLTRRPARYDLDGSQRGQCHDYRRLASVPDGRAVVEVSTSGVNSAAALR